MNLGTAPQPTAPWRPLIFRVHCIVTQRWMKIRVPFNWFWFGDQEYGTPEVESGTIAASNPQPPALGPRLSPGTPLPGDGPQQTEEELQPYRSPTRQQLSPGHYAEPVIRRGAPTPDEEMVDMRERLRQLEGQIDQVQRGPDTNRGGR